jgi:opacity protein-like surface antigen
MTQTRRSSSVLLVFAVLLLFSARDAFAEGFITPFIGYNFGGESGCVSVTNCTDRRLDWGAAFGAFGSIIGFETDFGYTSNFFGESAGQTSSVLTVMGNVLIGPKLGPVQPYGLIGAGLMRTAVSQTSITSSDENQFGWDIGGGLFAYFSSHVGIRGDVRYFRSFQVLDFANFPNLGLQQTHLDFGRASIAVAFKF